MRIPRRKVSAPYTDLVSEIDRLLRLDEANQVAFSGTRGPRITRHQLHLMTESIFVAAFRMYEGFISDVFLLYCLEKRPRSGRRVKSFLQPKDFFHAGSLIQSSMPFLDWTSPATVIKRAETYLSSGFPIKLPYTSHKEILEDLKRLRNHIAHDSWESLNGYKIVLKRHYLTIPLILPAPGEFLLLPNRTDAARYNLQFYLDTMKDIGGQIT